MISLTFFSPILAPFHLVAYSTLLGTQIFHSFVNVKVLHSTLPRPQFTTIQKRLFPIYFCAQTLLVALTIVSYPFTAASQIYIVKIGPDAVLLGMAQVLAVANLFIYGPRTSTAMTEIIHQGQFVRSNDFSETMERSFLHLNTDKRTETRDTRSSTNAIKSEEMMNCVRKFRLAHAMSIHLNLITIALSLWYGIRLAGKFDKT
jgi:hypothetical protein